jgi:hypothetical protein
MESHGHGTGCNSADVRPGRTHEDAGIWPIPLAVARGALGVDRVFEHTIPIDVLGP